MKFGICGGPELATLAKQAGYDYWEWSVPGLLKPLEDDKAFEAALQAARATGFPCPVLNSFVPGSHKITGPAVDPDLLRGYVTVAFTRAKKAGVAHIVFGSGGARAVPQDFTRAEARRQIVAFLKMAAPLAAENGVTVAIEPLNPRECNILTSVAECAAVMREVNHPAVRLLVDAYHFLNGDNALAEIEANGPFLSHTHVATRDNRLMPGAESCDLAPFFRALARGGYTGRMSFEGNLPEPDVKALADGLETMKRLEREAR